MLRQPVGALMLSANNRLRAGSGWSLAVERVAGAGYVGECQDLAAAPGPNGLAVGSAVVTGGGRLAEDDCRRWVLQAITVAYSRGGARTPATPEGVYGAVRAALERAELFRISAVATYLMAQRPGYASRSPDEMAEALMRALVDHGRIASALTRRVVCVGDTTEADRARRALDGARRARVGG